MTSNELHRAEFEANQDLEAPTRPCQRCGMPLVVTFNAECCGWPVDCRARAHITRPIQPARFLNDPAYRRVIETYPTGKPCPGCGDCVPGFITAPPVYCQHDSLVSNGARCADCDEERDASMA